MKAKFVGDPNAENETVPAVHEAYGLAFEKGKYTDIPAELEGKFAGNNHFVTSGAEAAKPE